MTRIRNQVDAWMASSANLEGKSCLDLHFEVVVQAMILLFEKPVCMLHFNTRKHKPLYLREITYFM